MDVKTTLTWLLRDQVSGTAKTINGNLDKLGLKTKQAAGGFNFMGIGILGAVGALAGFAKAAADEQLNVAKLSASLQANIKDWDGNTDAIEATISKREDLAFSDDDLRDSLALLVGATHDVTKAFDIQRTAMDLARLKGISLQDASTSLIKVQGGQYRSLKELGIVLKDGATQTEALAAVQKVAAGQASAYADTQIGKIETLKNRWGDFTEDVGGATLTVLDNLGTGLHEIHQRLGELDGSIPTVSMNISKHLLGSLQHVDKEARDTAKSIDAITTATSNLADESRDDIETFAKTLGIFARYEHLLSLGTATGKGGRGNIDAGDALNPRSHKVQTGEGHGSPRAAGGWAGLSGPEIVRVGERGPEYISPTTPNGQSGGGGFTIQGVSAAQISEMVDRQLYFKLSRASKNAVRP